MARRYSSWDEFYREIEALLARLDSGGQADSAAAIRDGLEGINGLTDGWAYCMGSFERAEKAYASDDKDLLKELKALHAVVRKLVYR